MSVPDQREVWNGQAGRSWVALQERLTAIFAPVTEMLIAAARPQPGDHILDIGCGSGDTTLAIAPIAGTGGSALGVDISAPLLDLARRRALASGSPATFVDADAAILAPQRLRDLLVSRFGVMFFDDPAAAFTNLRAHAKPDARLVFACWQPPRANHWATVPMRALKGLLPATEPADPHAPGPFAFADMDRVRAMLGTAGWRDIAAEPRDFQMRVGDGSEPLKSAIDYILTIGPAARAVHDAGPSIALAARAALTAALAPYAAEDGVCLPAAIWLVTARA